MGGSDSLTGHALLATPVIGDDRFARAVILLVEHNADGALGLVLNQPGITAVADAVPQWEPWAADPAVVFTGGPVATDRALGLGLLCPGAGAWPHPDAVFTALAHQWPATGSQASGTVGLIDLSADPDELGAVNPTVRVYAGYAGWSAGQLEGELSVGAWWTTPVTTAEVFDDDPGTLWKRVVARQPGDRALFARFTGDPGLN